MSNGSHMVGGRTYRNIITTNEVEIKKAEEPKKLTVITTAKIPGPTAQPVTAGMDVKKMITTHDEERDWDDASKDEIEMELEKPITLAEPKKKAGRPKKE